MPRIDQKRVSSEKPTKKYGLDGTDLIFDALSLPISTGQEDDRTAGIETLQAVERIKKELPSVNHSGG